MVDGMWPTVVLILFRAEHFALKIVPEIDISPRAESGLSMNERDIPDHNRRSSLIPSTNPEEDEERYYLLLRSGTTKMLAASEEYGTTLLTTNPISKGSSLASRPHLSLTPSAFLGCREDTDASDGKVSMDQGKLYSVPSAFAHTTLQARHMKMKMVEVHQITLFSNPSPSITITKTHTA